MKIAAREHPKRLSLELRTPGALQCPAAASRSRSRGGRSRARGASGKREERTARAAAGPSGPGNSVTSVNAEEDSGDEEDWGQWTFPGPSPPPTLPTAGLPDWIRDHVRSVAAFTQTPPGMAVMFALAGLSTALANKGVVEIRPGWTEPLLLWTMTVLEPANRKSAVLKLMLDPIWEYEHQLVEEIRPVRQEARKEREILQNALTKKEKQLTKAIANAFPKAEEEEIRERIAEIRGQLSEHEVPEHERLVADDITGEALGQLMANNHGRAAILSAEGEIFRNMAGRYGDKPVFNVFKKAWSGDERLRDDRVTREGSQVERPALTLGLGVQPELFRSLTEKESFRGEGLFGRFLSVQPDSPVGHRKTGEDVPKLNREAQERYNRNLRTLLESEPAEANGGEWVPHHLPLSGEAREQLFVFEGWVEEQLRTELDTLKDWGGKLVGNAARVAGLLHVAERVEEGDLWSESVSANAMGGAAIDLGRSLIPHAKTVFAEMAMDPKVRRQRYVLRRIQEAEEPHELTVRDVHRFCGGKDWVKQVSDVKNVLRQLQGQNLVRLEKRRSENGRPPSDWVRLHPELREEIDRTDRTPAAVPPDEDDRG